MIPSRIAYWRKLLVYFCIIFRMDWTQKSRLKVIIYESLIYNKIEEKMSSKE